MNLLYIFTDEQRFDTLRAYGNTHIHTPNLDRLARQSVVFDRAYVTQSVCTPSRSSLLTGMYPHNTGCVRNNIALRADTPSLAERVSGEGFRTGYMGKWHLGDEVFSQHGFDEWVSIEDGYNGHFSPGRDRHATSSYFNWIEPKGVADIAVSSEGYRGIRRDTAARLPEQYSKPAFLAQEASRFIEENAEDPFILFVSFLEPHMPFFGPRDDQYDPDAIPLPANFNAWPGQDQSRKDRGRIENKAGYQQFLGTDQPTDHDWRRLTARYWGLVSQVDTAVGNILDALEKSGAWDDTLIVFTSDHGDQMGSHGMISKGTQYEESIRVPLLLRVPGHAMNGRHVTTPISQVDLVPTLLDYLEHPTADDLDGASLRPYLDKGEAEPKRDVFIEWNPLRPDNPDDVPIRTVITPDLWKFNRRLGDANELYHLATDPLETENLATHAEHHSRIAELIGCIECWQDQTHDTAWNTSP